MPLKKQNFIFYGTLRDPDIQKIVAGPELASKFWRSQTLPGYALVHVAGMAYPGLRLDAAASFVADLYLDLDPAEQHAIEVYEAEEYQLTSWQIEGRAFQIFLPAPHLVLSDINWHLQDFQKSLKSTYLMTLGHG